MADPNAGMDNQVLQWIVGIFLTVFLAVSGWFIAALRSMGARIKDGDEALHSRINDVRADYVRRDDYKDAMSELKQTVEAAREESNANHRALLMALNNKNSPQN